MKRIILPKEDENQVRPKIIGIKRGSLKALAKEAVDLNFPSVKQFIEYIIESKAQEIQKRKKK